MSFQVNFKFIKWISQFDVRGESVPCFESSSAESPASYILVLVRLVFNRYLSVERSVLAGVYIWISSRADTADCSGAAHGRWEWQFWIEYDAQLAASEIFPRSAGNELFILVWLSTTRDELDSESSRFSFWNDSKCRFLRTWSLLASLHCKFYEFYSVHPNIEVK